MKCIKYKINDSVRVNVRDTIWDEVRDTIRGVAWDTVWLAIGDGFVNRVRFNYEGSTKYSLGLK